VVKNNVEHISRRILPLNSLSWETQIQSRNLDNPSSPIATRITLSCSSHFSIFQTRVQFLLTTSDWLRLRRPDLQVLRSTTELLNLNFNCQPHLFSLELRLSFQPCYNPLLRHLSTPAIHFSTWIPLSRFTCDIPTQHFDRFRHSISPPSPQFPLFQVSILSNFVPIEGFQNRTASTSTRFHNYSFYKPISTRTDPSVTCVLPGLTVNLYQSFQFPLND